MSIRGAGGAQQGGIPQEYSGPAGMGTRWALEGDTEGALQVPCGNLRTDARWCPPVVPSCGALQCYSVQPATSKLSSGHTHTHTHNGCHLRVELRPCLQALDLHSLPPSHGHTQFAPSHGHTNSRLPPSHGHTHTHDCSRHEYTCDAYNMPQLAQRGAAGSSPVCGHARGALVFVCVCGHARGALVCVQGVVVTG